MRFTASFVSMFVLAALASGAETKGVDLTGVITNSDGAPIAGARVLIHTAGPRTGTSPLCPSCYADCTKKGVTDAEGRFVIARLDPELIFRVLVVADGHAPKLVGKVDPAAKPLAAKLSPRPADLDLQKTVRGRVVNKKGEPIEAATVEPFGMKQGERRMWGGLKSIDPLAVTDARGEFLIACNAADMALDLKVSAREFSPRVFELLPAGKPHELQLDEGATIRGRVLRDGRPVANLPLGVAHTNRSAGEFLGHFEIGTDANGVFEFQHMPPGIGYYLYSCMTSGANLGALGLYHLDAGPDGSTADVGNLSLERGYRIAGRIILSDQQPLPEKTRLMLSREQAWDHQTVPLDERGNFVFEGVPQEAVSLIVRVPGYRLIPGRSRLQATRDNTLGMYVDKDRDDVWIYLEREKGPR